jgi:hypothetical protein
VDSNVVCKCPYYCKKKGNCEECQTDKCDGSLKTYCGKDRHIPEEHKKEPIIKKEAPKESIWASDEERSIYVPPVLVGVIDIIDNWHHVRRNKKYPPANLGIRYGRGILFNDNGQLIVCGSQLYDVKSGNLLKDYDFQDYDLNEYINSIHHDSGSLIRYSEGYIHQHFSYYAYDDNKVVKEYKCDEKTGISTFVQSKKYNCTDAYDRSLKNISEYKKMLNDVRGFHYENITFSFSDDNHIMIENSKGKYLFIEKIESNSKIFKGDYDLYFGFDYSPTSKHFAACLENGLLLIWYWDYKGKACSCNNEQENKERILASQSASTELARFNKNKERANKEEEHIIVPWFSSYKYDGTGLKGIYKGKNG